MRLCTAECRIAQPHLVVFEEESGASCASLGGSAILGCSGWGWVQDGHCSGQPASPDRSGNYGKYRESARKSAHSFLFPIGQRANQSGFTCGFNFLELFRLVWKMEQSFKLQVWAVEGSPGIPFPPTSFHQAAQQKLFPTPTLIRWWWGEDFPLSTPQAQDYKQQMMGPEKFPNSSWVFLSWKCFSSSGSQCESPSPTLCAIPVQGWNILGTTSPPSAVVG